MATFSVLDSTALRNAIQAAVAGDLIDLMAAGPYSVTTLAKMPSLSPVVAGSGYVIQGNGSTVLNTRILQQNVDGPFGPGTVQGTTNNLNLVYSSGGAADGTALLRATSASYTLNRVNVNGVHRGWDGNGGLYMSLSSFNYAAPSNVSFSFRNSAVNVTGQGGFNPATGLGGSAFLHSWNNIGSVLIDTVNFNENGYLSSFHFSTFDNSLPIGSPPPSPLGTYTIRNSTFRRTNPASRIFRFQGNILDNVRAQVGVTGTAGNVFQDGAYLELRTDTSQVRFGGANTFITLADGFGIVVSGSGSPTLDPGAQLTFSGPGLPVRYIAPSSDNGNPNAPVFRLNTLVGSVGRNISIGTTSFQEVIAGSQFANNIVPTGLNTNIWVNGDIGDDTILGSSGNDVLLGGTGNDSINGYIGSDSIDGGSGNDILLGDIGNDNLSGAADNDYLDGGDGQDQISGGTGNDTLVGAAADDTLTGGVGADTFKLLSGNLTDAITDFATAEDQFSLDNFPGLPLPSNQTLPTTSYSEIASLAALGVANNQQVVEIANGELSSDIEFNSFAAVAAYILVYNIDSGVGELWYDDNWSDNFGDRFRVAQLTNFTSAAQLGAFANTNFYIH